MPERKSQLRSGADRLLAHIRHPVLEHAVHRTWGRRPARSCLLKSGASSPSEPVPWPKSNSRRKSSVNRMPAENGWPCLLRKPVSGPMNFLVISSDTSSGDHSRPEQHRPDVEIAGLALELAVGLLDDAAVLGAGGGDGGESLFRNVAGLDALHQVPRHLLDVLHELLARQLGLFHLLELELPVAGEFRRGEFIDAEMPQREQQARTPSRWVSAPCRGARRISR